MTHSKNYCKLQGQVITESKFHDIFGDFDFDFGDKFFSDVGFIDLECEGDEENRKTLNYENDKDWTEDVAIKDAATRGCNLQLENHLLFTK